MCMLTPKLCDSLSQNCTSMITLWLAVYSCSVCVCVCVCVCVHVCVLCVLVCVSQFSGLSSVPWLLSMYCSSTFTTLPLIVEYPKIIPTLAWWHLDLKGTSTGPAVQTRHIYFELFEVDVLLPDATCMYTTSNWYCCCDVYSMGWLINISNFTFTEAFGLVISLLWLDCIWRHHNIELC